MNINTFLPVSNLGKSRIVIGDFPEQSLNRYNVSSVREKRTDTGSQRLDDRNITDTWTSLMKPHQVKSEPQNRRISNIECRRVGSLRSVIFYKIDRIPYFDIRYSLFDIRYSLFQSFFFDQTGHFWPAAGLNPCEVSKPLNPEL